MAQAPDFMRKKETVTIVPQVPGDPQNPAKPTPDWMRKKEVPPTGDAPPPPGPTVWEDVKDIAPRAARTGVEMVPAGPAEMSGLVPALVKGILSKLNEAGLLVGGEATLKEFDTGLQDVMQPQPGVSMDPRDAAGLDVIRENITDPMLGQGQDVEAQTPVGGMVQTGLEVGPSIAMGPGGLLQKAGMIGGTAGGSEGAGQIAEAADLSPGWTEAAKIAGGLAGGFAPQAWNRMVNPRPVPPSRQPLIDTLRGHNVPISAGQLSGDKNLMRREMMSGGTSAHEAQPAAFTGAAADVQGGFAGNGPRGLTREGMLTERNRMGSEFDRLQGAANPVSLGNQHISDLVGIADDYKLNTPLTAPIVQKVVDDIQANAAANGGFMGGEQFQTARSTIGKIIDGSDDPSVQKALLAVQDVLDDAMQLGLSPQDQAAFRRVRAEYRNYIPIERARAAPGAEEGFVSPAQLKQSIGATQGRRELATGQGDMTELAEAGAGVIKPPQSSGTAENLRAQLAGLIPAAAGGLGGAAASHAQLPIEAIIAASGGAASLAHLLPKLRDAFTVSDAGQAFHSRQGPRVNTDRELLASLLAAARLAAAQEGQQSFSPADSNRAGGPR